MADERHCQSGKLHGMNEQLSAQEKQLAVQCRKIESLRQQLDAVSKELATIENSTSWKLTKPLRLIMEPWRYGLSPLYNRYLRGRIGPSLRKLPFGSSLVNGIKRCIRRNRHDDFKNIPASLPLLKARKKGMPDYIIWGVIDWYFRYQRPQQLAEGIARTGRRVFYISSELISDSSCEFRCRLVFYL